MGPANQSAAPSPLQAGSDLFLVSAADDAGLPAALQNLERGLALQPDAPLRDFAYSVGRDFDPARPCVAIVATSHADLARKLQVAVQRLQSPGVDRVHQKDGLYYYRQRLGRTGGLAFLFPGEGAQYPNMLRDLCLRFPEMREAFDEVDIAYGADQDGVFPSHSVFPPPGTVPHVSADIYGWQQAVMIVLAANTGLMRLCRHLGLQPRATVGHSYGEFSAFEMAGILRAANRAERIEGLRLSSRQMQEIAGLTNIPPATLLTVGGVERHQIAAVVAPHAQAVSVAMENCPHQYILCVTGPDRASIVATMTSTLTAAGAICVPLAFDRPYHSPHLLPTAGLAREFYLKAGIHAPEIDVYSCCSAARFPSDPATIIDLATRHWSEPVRFQSTIDAMYADGIRVFLETGPRGNLCAFVDDILRGKPHVAIPADREHRGGLLQLQHALAQLAAHGVGMNIAYLHERRGSVWMDPATWERPSAHAAGRLVRLSVATPLLRADSYVAEFGPLARTAALAAPVAPVASPLPPAVVAPAVELPSGRETAMLAFLETMNQFLATQDSILTQAAVATLPAAPPAPAPVDALPLLGELERLDPGVGLEAVKTHSIDEDLYLLDHTLGTTTSVFDPALRALPIMPFLFSMEIVGEAAVTLFPGHVVTAFVDVRANRWIFFERGVVRLRAIARRVASADGEVQVRVEIREDAGGDPRARFRPCSFEATAVLERGYPSQPTPGKTLTLREPEDCRWSGAAIYPKRTFHGPRFQGIRSINRIGDNGLTGDIEVLPRHDLLASTPAPALVSDPLLLDAMGQSIWVWGNRQLHSGHFFLPFSVDAFHLPKAPLPAGTKLTLNLELLKQENGIIACTVQAVDAAGHLCAEMINLQDRDFAITPALHAVLLEPLDHALSMCWAPPPEILVALQSRPVFTRIAGYPRSLFESSSGVWHRAWAFLILNPPEREAWLALAATPRRQLEWLWGRTAAKDAVRLMLQRDAPTRLGAADIQIDVEAGGRPVVKGGWRGVLPHVPSLSIAHTGDMAVAAAGDRDWMLGIDVERVREPSADLLDGAFGSEERALLEALPGNRAAWTFRLWCAKEAAGKALGTGILRDPKAWRIRGIESATGAVTLCPPPDAAPAPIPALTVQTFQQDDDVYAISEYRPPTAPVA